MKLSYAQRCEIFENGFVKVPGVVPRIMVEAALQHIHANLGEGMDPKEMPVYRAQSFCRELQRHPVITDLLNKTPAWELAESVLGEGNIRPVTSAQIALRFPVLQDPPKPPVPHLDGMHSPHNGVPAGTIQNFTMLVGVLLSDVTREYAGNFTVWPGTHRLYEQYFRQHGAEALLQGMPPVELPEPKQVLGQVGDVIFAHYQLAHGVAMNVSPYIRYAVFFRLYHKDFSRERWQEPMLDIWLHWPGMRDIVQERAR
ncbi:hypothetical protein GCM10010885_24190 [Alicyclobacillus cellulosilyticus]|uniref:Phytanoyl-CoA dioxygenase PhyH n=1 Tax=Alicyclobacillus cellulosilyticus TaxID=1003997 RepID=A0A917KJB3_9BACL|nr:phytanoyl-CoA dioxygenase family protein [Alicyclobacillus cellulosilyticus]GGJ13997.1 hypothetical protein GCM10010885_24190 [Alicyclobacillus cellulosilyticus]